jgi:uncharacterized membrane protein
MMRQTVTPQHTIFIPTAMGTPNVTQGYYVYAEEIWLIVAVIT